MSTDNEDTMTIAVDHGKKRLLFSQWGVLDKASAMRSYHMLHGVEGFSPEYDTLVDYRGISEVAIGFGELKEILAEAKRIEKRTGRAALVVGTDQGRYAFSQLFCVISSKFSSAAVKYQAFRTMEEGERWLDGVC